MNNNSNRFNIKLLQLLQTKMMMMMITRKEKMNIGEGFKRNQYY